MRGLDEKHEHGASEMARDTRPLGERVGEFFANPQNVIVMLGTAVVGCILFPGVSDLSLLFSLVVFLFCYFHKQTLPLKMPQVCGLPDFNDTIPGTKIARPAKGIAFLGNQLNTSKELWVTNDDLRTHILIFGSTGAGKTETLVSLVYNSLVQGSGFIYIDGKGDNSLYSKIFAMCRRMGREDDLLLVNFMTGARDIIGAQKTRLSNTMNPFAFGSSSMLSQLVVSLMDSGGQSSGDGDMWKNRAISFVEALMKILTAMRDAGHILLDANVIRNYFILEKLEQIVVDKRFPLSETESVPLDNMPEVILEPINNYIINLPGYNRARKGNQASEVREQHGFITMQLTRTFSSLADTYGHILRVNLAEVDMKDVVLNRRILVVLLPALEKSPEELSNLGKIIIATLKTMMAAGLGDEVEGTYRDVIQRKPTTSPTPFVCVMDEYGYYAVKGFAVVPAQARSLGFCAVFAGQDLPAFQKASKEEAASIGANCNIKICMKLEDPTETWDFFNKSAGETYATSVSNFQINSGSMTQNYLDTKSANIEKRSRIDLLDLKDQREGDAHIFYRSKIIRCRMFYASPKPVKRMQVNQYLGVDRPTDHQLAELDKRLRRFYQVFNDANFILDAPAYNAEITLMADALRSYETLKPFERSVAAVISILEEEVEKQQMLRDEPPPDPSEFEEGVIHAFTPVPVPEQAYGLLKPDDMPRFSSPLLLKGRTHDAVVHIERLSGKIEPQALSVADNLFRDILKSTEYPPIIDWTADPEDIKKLIQELIDQYSGRRRVGGTSGSATTTSTEPTS